MSTSKRKLQQIYNESVERYRRDHTVARDALTRMRQAHEDLINWRRKGTKTDIK